MGGQEKLYAPPDLYAYIKNMVFNNNNNLNMPDRPSSGLTTTALSIGLSQDRRAKLAIGDIVTKNKKIKLAPNNNNRNMECKTIEQV